jgi:hypothetical protein
MEHADVSMNEIIQFYADNNITNYPKTKKGLPNMSCSINKKTKLRLMKQKILEQNKKENKDSYTTSKEEYYRNEILSMNDEELSELSELTETCAICLESMSEDYCMLKCEHMFCVNCIANYCQTNNKCPLCREQFCDIVNKKKNNYQYNESNHNRLMYFSEDIVESVLTEGFHYNGCNESDHGHGDDENEAEHNDSMHNFEDFLEVEMEDLKSLMKLYSKNKDIKYTFDDYIDNMARNMKNNLETLLNETILQTEETISSILRMN